MTEMSYQKQVTVNKPYFLGIAGGTGSGKTCAAQMVLKSIGGDRAIIISSDGFYHDFTGNADMANFDIVESIDFSLMSQLLYQFKNGEDISIPTYDFKTHRRTTETIELSPKNIDLVIVEGILIFAVPEIRAVCDFMVFIQADADIRLGRRMVRDINERGRDIQSVLDQWVNTVKPAHDSVVEPSSVHADIIIPNTERNKFNGINHLCNFMSQIL